MTKPWLLTRGLIASANGIDSGRPAQSAHCTGRPVPKPFAIGQFSACSWTILKFIG